MQRDPPTARESVIGPFGRRAIFTGLLAGWLASSSAKFWPAVGILAVNPGAVRGACRVQATATAPSAATTLASSQYAPLGTGPGRASLRPDRGLALRLWAGVRNPSERRGHEHP